MSVLTRSWLRIGMSHDRPRRRCALRIWRRKLLHSHSTTVFVGRWIVEGSPPVVLKIFLATRCSAWFMHVRFNIPKFTCPTWVSSKHHTAQENGCENRSPRSMLLCAHARTNPLLVSMSGAIVLGWLGIKRKRLVWLANTQRSVCRESSLCMRSCRSMRHSECCCAHLSATSTGPHHDPSHHNVQEIKPAIVLPTWQHWGRHVNDQVEQHKGPEEGLQRMHDGGLGCLKASCGGRFRRVP